MTETILADYPALISAINGIGDKLDTNNTSRQWMNKEQARKHLNLGKQAFQKLIDDGVVPVHDLATHGLARMERYNRDELDEAMKSI